MATRLRMAMSRAAGWLADRRVPTFLRGPLYRSYAAFTGARLEESRGPLSIYPSLSAFFVRRLVEGARTIEADASVLVSPVDGTIQRVGRVERGTLLQAKGRSYLVRELLAGVGAEIELEGGQAWTIYLGPRDYHRVHAPETCVLSEACWMPGTRYSVAPRVLASRPVLALNERCCLRLETHRGPLLMVLVGALNVGRIRVLGVEPGRSGRLEPAPSLERGEELGRFELGSTVVLIAPPGRARASVGAVAGASVRLGSAIGRYVT